MKIYRNDNEEMIMQVGDKYEIIVPHEFEKYAVKKMTGYIRDIWIKEQLVEVNNNFFCYPELMEHFEFLVRKTVKKEKENE